MQIKCNFTNRHEKSEFDLILAEKTNSCSSYGNSKIGQGMLQNSAYNAARVGISIQRF